MSYESSEISIASGQPIELYDIVMGLTHWRLTSSGEDYEYLGQTYESSPCKRSQLEQTGEIPKDGVEVELPRGHALGLICIAGTPEQEVTLTIYRGHSGFFVIYFRGFLTSVKIDGKGIPTARFEPRSSDLPFVGGRRRCMRLCGHKLYGYRCGLDNEAHKITGTIDSIDGLTITASEFGEAGIEIPEVFGNDITGLQECSYSASSDASHAKNAFDNKGYWWTSSNPNNEWIWCKWNIQRKIRKVTLRPYLILILYGIEQGHGIRRFRIQASNNGSDWTNIDAKEWLGNCSVYIGQGGNDTECSYLSDHSERISIILDNNSSYYYWRIYIFDSWSKNGTVNTLRYGVENIYMYEAVNSMVNYQFGAGGEIIVGTARRTITSHVGDTITINRPFGSNVVAGAAFSAYAGCDHTPDCCREKFDNILNYGGQEFLPTKNPYTGNLIY
jgi:hypothetical protein